MPAEFDDTKSFAPVGMPIIPGSSLRGMFKNIFKIVTCGAFLGRTNSQRKGEDFNDEHIYFRCMMGVGRYPWTKDLNKVYNSRMIHNARGKDGKLHPVKNARPGFLIRTTDNKFFIAPSIYKSDRKDDWILIRDYEKKFRVTIRERNSSCVKWDGNIAYIITGSQAWCRDHWIPLPEDVRTSYEHDRNRRGVNLFTDKGVLKRGELEQLTEQTFSDVKTLIPCHFLEEDGQITAFGHGQCFRIPYRRRIGDAVPKTLQSEKIVDFADAVFGKEKFWASRVYFEDATPIGEVRELATATAHPLMQPNPTSYQLYLAQHADKLNHWDTNGAQIRGYKLYWHKPATDWHANDNELKLDSGKTPDKRLTGDMTPLAEGSRFAAKIRFKNLSAVELGALMMIFDIDGLKDGAYKIGMGKPFGFGSVKITPTTFRIDDFDAPYPRADLIFGSLADKWTQAAMPSNADKKIIREFATQLRLTEWHGQSKKFYFTPERGTAAFWGKFFYSVEDLSADIRKVFMLLAKFGEFAGVGRLTG